jgi:transcriptional regulator with XRE-family HTH domain
MGAGFTPQEALGQAIWRIRDERGLDQANIAGKADVALSQLSRLEHGKMNPTWGTIRRIAGALGLPMSELIARAERIEQSG